MKQPKHKDSMWTRHRPLWLLLVVLGALWVVLAAMVWLYDWNGGLHQPDPGTGEAPQETGHLTDWGGTWVALAFVPLAILLAVYAVWTLVVADRGVRFSKLSADEQKRRKDAGRLLRGESIGSPPDERPVDAPER